MPLQGIRFTVTQRTSVATFFRSSEDLTKIKAVLQVSNNSNKSQTRTAVSGILVCCAWRPVVAIVFGSLRKKTHAAGSSWVFWILLEELDVNRSGKFRHDWILWVIKRIRVQNFLLCLLWSEEYYEDNSLLTGPWLLNKPVVRGTMGFAAKDAKNPLLLGVFLDKIPRT